MTEWLNQYERVAQRQQQYLQKIRDLRQRLQTKDERYMMLSIERLRNTPRQESEPLPLPVHKNPDYKSHVPWSSSLLAHSFYPKMSCPSPRLLADASELPSLERPAGSYACVVSGERLLPKQHPKHLHPLPAKHLGKDKGDKPGAPESMALERNKTDYEPIESIARRNRIQFSGYLTAGDEHREQQGGRRETGRRESGQEASRALSVVAHAGDVSHREDV